MTAALLPLRHVMCLKVNLNQMQKIVYSRNLCFECILKPCIVLICEKLNLQNRYQINQITKRHLSTNKRLCGPGVRPSVTGGPGLSKQQAEELTLKLTTEERVLLLTALQEYQSKIVKDEYIGQLAANRWRSKFGRPSKLPSLGDVDPTGSYCPVPEDWLRKKCVQSVAPPSSKELVGIAFANSIPFIGFGFLDNFIMIIAGDYIDITLGSYLCLSTMAAAALGNTFSDVMGIGSAYYVERLANYIGYQPPKLTPIQLDMPVSRQFANLGRVLGVTVGCLLGMFPLLFFSKDEAKIKRKLEESNAKVINLETTD